MNHPVNTADRLANFSEQVIPRNNFAFANSLFLIFLSPMML